jgi:ABC-type sugar transport system substrate-binding protein
MRRIDPSKFPDFTNRKVVDRHMGELDTHGVSRREFLAFASAAAIATTAAGALGFPNVALASTSGKLAHLQITRRLEYSVGADVGAVAAAEALGLSHASFDGELDPLRQLNQFEQQAAAGTNGIILHAVDGSAIKRIAETANRDKIWLTNTWGTLPWFTPFDAGDYWTLYAVPEELSAHGAVTTEVAKAIVAKFGGGKVVGVTGIEGNSTDLIRSRGRDAALKAFPTIELVGELPGKWNREDSQKATQDLLSRHPDLVGVIGQNDDVAAGVLAALNEAGRKPGEDVFVGGADGTDAGVRAIRSGKIVATSANVPAYLGGLLTARIYDVLNGYQPKDAERLLYWRSVTTTKDNVDGYIARYVDNNGVAPFDYARLSKVKHPNDWDPQAEIFPIDIESEWAGIPKPANWKAPERYAAIWTNGEAEAVRADYAAHYKIKFDGPSPNVKS